MSSWNGPWWRRITAAQLYYNHYCPSEGWCCSTAVLFTRFFTFCCPLVYIPTQSKVIYKLCSYPSLSRDRNATTFIISHRIATHVFKCDQYLKARACLMRCFLSAESLSGNWTSKVRMRSPLWEGSCDNGIPSPVTTFLYAGLMCHGKQIRNQRQENNDWCRLNSKHILLQMSLFISVPFI